MILINKHILAKLVRKNRGNTKLLKEVNKLINDIEISSWKTPHELTSLRADADYVHDGDFYFFNINIHRVLILIEFDSRGRASIAWAGNHDDYELTFKNNKRVIRKWLRDNNWIK